MPSSVSASMGASLGKEERSFGEEPAARRIRVGGRWERRTLR